MHNIKLIRKDPDFFKKKLSERNIKFDLNVFLDLDKKNRDLIQNKEKLEQEKKIISQKKDKSLFAKSKELSLKIESICFLVTDISSSYLRRFSNKTNNDFGSLDIPSKPFFSASFIEKYLYSFPSIFIVLREL